MHFFIIALYKFEPQIKQKWLKWASFSAKMAVLHENRLSRNSLIPQTEMAELGALEKLAFCKVWLMVKDLFNNTSISPKYLYRFLW